MSKDELWKSIGINIKQERLSRNLTLDELAFFLQLTPDILDSIERGSHNITASCLHNLSKIFGIPIDTIMLGYEKNIFML